MNDLMDVLVVTGWLVTFLALPFVLGVAICRGLRVKEFSGRLGWVLFSIFLAIAPFAAKIVQTERLAYREPGADWVSLADTTLQTDPKTGEPYRAATATGKRLEAVRLRSNEIERRDGKWYLVPPKQKDADKSAKEPEKPPETPSVEVVKQTTFDLSRWKDALSFGIDLDGGTNLFYEVDKEKAEADEITIDDNLMERLVGAVSRRVNPAGTKEIVVRRVGQMRIEIILPGADPAVVEETKQQITQLGSLEFSIVANRIDHGTLIQRALASPSADVRVGDRVEARWRPIAPEKDEQGNDIPNPDFDGDPEIAVRQVAGKRPGFKEILILNEPNPAKQITGKLLKRANPTNDEEGRPAVGFHFDFYGAELFRALTRNYGPRKDGSERRLAVMLNGGVHTAPSIKTTIGADGIIQGKFTQKEVKELVDILNAGALPVPIKTTPISEFSISPTLGSDVQSKGKLALWVSSVAVIAFMAGYYFVAGLVADLALLLNLLFIVGIMALVKAAFTLPGLAGLVLSAGMAVDANVLIYERIREELQRGASLRMAIHNGFDKAFAAIFDSNITTIITAVILYMIGTETVKGFAVSLFIGLVMNLYTAVYISRLVMNILERSRLIKKLRMLSLVGVTRFDFVGKQFVASAASVALILAGLAAFIARGSLNYDIDFTGGISVTMQFNDPQQMETVRDKLEQTFDKGITVEELRASEQVAEGTYFRLRVAKVGAGEIDPADVEQRVNGAFPGLLVRKNLQVGESTEIAAAEEDESPDNAADASDLTIERFAGGSRVALSFTDDKGAPSPIAPATFERYLQVQLGARQVDGKQKYPNAEDLFATVGTAGPGLATEEGKVRLYTGLDLRVSSAVAPDDLREALAAIQTTMKDSPVFDEVTSFESSVAGETKRSAVIAVIASLIAIVAYLWLRFENVIFGLAAVVALAHDVLVSLGCVALASYLSRTPLGPPLLLTDFKINMPMIAAFLTIVGYSINDTIVIFDRLREIRGKNSQITRDMINLTVNQCLSRTILTALTVFITVAILYAVGGEGIHGFAFRMVVGSIAGTYSTVYIASPLVLWFMQRASRGTPGRGAAAKPETAVA